MQKVTLGTQMKQYEECYNIRIPRHFPIIVRIDGRAFHSWTKKTHCARPYDEKLMQLMAETTRFLCENIGGCIFGYTQSDEISLLLRDGQSPESNPWFDKRIQKVVSISAAMATYYFTANNPFEKKFPAFFDSRAFAVPKEDIRGYFIWRQNDALKNSLSMLAQSLYPAKELEKKQHGDLLALCLKKGFDWNTLPVPKKQGYAVYKQTVTVHGRFGPVERQKFLIDENIPIFAEENCKLFEKLNSQM